jgi:hypothetical protein
VTCGQVVCNPIVLNVFVQWSRARCEQARVMTRNQQVRRALELLAPRPHQRAECRHDIELMLKWIERSTATARTFRIASSKKGKAGVSSYYAALRRLRNAYHSLDPAIRPWFSLVETAYIIGKPTIVEREIAIAELFLDRPSPPPRPDAARNKGAVAAAYHLLAWWGHKISITRSGKWAQLAKILTGDRTIDLFEHLREFSRRRR